MIKQFEHLGRSAASRIDGTSERQVRQNYHELWNHVRITEQLPAADGTSDECTWELADVSRLITLVLENSPQLQDIYAAALEQHPGTIDRPWKLLVGFDEYAPGSQLKCDNKKKVMNVFLNFEQLGHHAISLASTWFTVISVQTSFIARVKGGWSYMLATFLRRVLLGPTGLSTAGLPLSLRGRPHMLWVQLHAIISDADGLRQAYSWRGAASLRPCLRHNNVVAKNSDLTSRMAGLVEISCHDPSLFHCTTSEEFWAACDRVRVAVERRRERQITQKLCDYICKAEGLNYCESGLCWSKSLRHPAVDIFKASRYDWAHSCLQDGCFSKEAHLYISSSGADYKDVEQYFRLAWQFPHQHQHKGNDLWRVFSDWRRDSDNQMSKLRASMTELISLYVFCNVTSSLQWCQH